MECLKRLSGSKFKIAEWALIGDGVYYGEYNTSRSSATNENDGRGGPNEYGHMLRYFKIARVGAYWRCAVITYVQYSQSKSSATNENDGVTRIDSNTC